MNPTIDKIKSSLEDEEIDWDSLDDDIAKIFFTVDDFNIPKSIAQHPKECFITAKKLYKSVASNKPKSVVFYKMSDLEKNIKKFYFAFEHLKTPCYDFLKTGEIEGLSFFLQKTFCDVSKPNADSIAAQYLINALQSQNPKNKPQGKMDLLGWINNSSRKFSSMITNEFYEVENYDQACHAGEIYEPGFQKHNWGVNASWVLALTLNHVEIKIKSDLVPENAIRSYPNPNDSLNPSALSLEIAIAVKMGYGLKIDGSTVTLVPPTVLKEQSNISIPTKQEEIEIFDECILARELHQIISEDDGIQQLQHNIDAFLLSEKNLLHERAFLNALDLLRKGNSLSPILDKLNNQQKKYLSDILKTDFQHHQYEELRGFFHSIDKMLYRPTYRLKQTIKPSSTIQYDENKSIHHNENSTPDPSSKKRKIDNDE